MSAKVWSRYDFAKGWGPGPWFTVTDVAGLTFRLAGEARRCWVAAAFPVAGFFTVLVECFPRVDDVEVALRLQVQGYEPWCPAYAAVLVRPASVVRTEALAAGGQMGLL